jgi:hypothetical protein
MSGMPLPESEWVLAVCENPSSLRTLSRVRQAMALPLSAVADLRGKLPGVCRRGPRDEMERLRSKLDQHGLRAAAFPAWQLEAPPKGEPDPLGDEDYAVYTAVGHTDLLRFELPDITFCDMLGDAPFCRRPVAERFHGPFRYRLLKDAGILADYERRNAEGGWLRKRFRTRGGYHLLSERRRGDLCDDGRNVVSLTRVGFGRAGTLALVGLSYYGGPLCGFGCFLLFERQKEDWQVLDRCGMWVS